MAWSRRDLILKSLAAAGAAAAAKLSGVVPEFGWMTDASAATHPDAPFYARKPAEQAEIEGAEKDTLLARSSASGDVREVLRQLSRPAGVDLAALDGRAVHSRMEDGSQLVAASAVLDHEHVLVHYQHSGSKSGGSTSHAFVYRLTSDHTAELVAASADGRAMRPQAPSGALPHDAALAAGCPWCYYSCEPSCCGYDFWGIVECCGPCGFTCLAGPWVCLACALVWCSFCVIRHCTRWCPNCCQYYYC